MNIEICKRKQKVGKENPSLFKQKAYLSRSILLIYQSVLSFIKKGICF